MSKVCVLVILLFSFRVYSETKTRVGLVKQNKDHFVILMSDSKGLQREFTIDNESKFALQLLRFKNKWVELVANTKNLGLRAGTIEIDKMDHEVIDPLKYEPASD